MMQHKFIIAHMNAAEVYSQLSSAIRLKVGCVIVKNDTIIGIGYNGMPSGWDNTCEYIADVHPSDPRYDYNNFSNELKTKPEALHAESNAIAKVARSTNSCDGATLFVTHAPCLDCAKMIYQAGIIEIYYHHPYRDSAGIEFLKKCNVKVETE